MKKKNIDFEALLNGLLESMGEDYLVDRLLASANEEILVLQASIKNELEYAKYETNSYKSAKQEALRYAKQLSKAVNEEKQVVKKLKEIKALRTKISKMW